MSRLSVHVVSRGRVWPRDTSTYSHGTTSDIGYEANIITEGNCYWYHNSNSIEKATETRNGIVGVHLIDTNHVPRG